MKAAFLRDLVPPLARRLLARARHRLHRRPPEGGCEQDADFYDRRFREREHLSRHYSESHYYPVWTVLADRMLRAGVRSILDIGCGPGQMAALLRDRGLTRYHGIDFSPERIAHARVLCPEFAFTTTNVLETHRWRDCDYDAVLCTEFLEHVERDLDVLDAIRPLTRCYLTVPSYPAAGHVRHFRNREEVVARYGPCFADLEVVEHQATLRGGRIFIMEGVRA